MIEILIIIFIFIVIAGALLGGKSFGGTIRKGCGCLAALLVIMSIILLVIGVIE